MRTSTPETAPPLPSPPLLSLRLFGPFAAAVHGQPMPKVRSQKEHWLLAMLALRAQAPLERSWLAQTLWPEATDDAARFNLRRTLTFLRDALGPEADRLRSPTPRTLRLDLDGAECDVTAFDAALRRGDPASLAGAVALYTGPLLLGCPEEWALTEQETRERAVLSALEALATGAQGQREWAEAVAHLRRALEIDPLRETALRALLQTLAAQGCHPAAAEAYHAFRRRVRDELNTEVDSETAALHRRIQEEGRRPAPPEPSVPGREVPEHAAHLPTPLTTLIGRADEITAVAASLRQSRLVTLTGAGGVGKTRLALAVASSLHPEFGNGAWFADLAPLADPKLLTAVLINTFGLREGSGRPPTETLVEFLRHRQLLLVLDNCEHLAEPCAHLALGLLQACPALRLLATSREPLRVPGEAARPVPGLPASEAARLFSERAVQSNPAFRLTPAGTEAVADICRRLDGLPLAIEMAAARTRVLPLPQIAARLGDALRLLSGPGGDLLPRHRTLRATLDWSYDLLTAGEKTLLARLSVFAGGWTLDAAEAVCAAPAEDARAGRITSASILDLLAGLVDKSLVVYDEQPDGIGRYCLLETVRQYASDRLAESGEAKPVRGQAAAWFLGFTEEAEPKLTGPEQASWLSRLEAEHDNLRASLAWYEALSDPEEEGLRLAGALSRFWYMRGRVSEGRQWLRKMMEKGMAADKDGSANRETSATRAKAINGAANLAYRQGDYAEARDLYEEGLILRRRSGDPQSIADTLSNLALVASDQGDYPRARALQEESLTMRRQLGDHRGIADSLSILGKLARYQGDYAGARALQEEALTERRQVGDQQSVANSLHNLGIVACEQGDYAGVRAMYEESLAIRRRLGNKNGIAASLLSLGNLASDQDDYVEARALYDESLTMRRQLGDQQGIATALHNLADLSCDQGDHIGALALQEECLIIRRRLGDQRGIAASLHSLGRVAYGNSQPERATRLWGAASSLRESINGSLTPSEQHDSEKSTASVRAALGESIFAVIWQEGRSLSREDAVDLALAGEDAADESENRFVPQR